MLKNSFKVSYITESAYGRYFRDAEAGIAKQMSGFADTADVLL